MKTTYIIALRHGWSPLLIKQKPLQSIAYIGRIYQNAYIFQTKKEAEKTRKEWYKLREERKDDPKYPDFY